MAKYSQLEETRGGQQRPSLEQPEETFVFPASVEQNRYWTLAQLDPNSTASNMAISFEIDGPLDEMLVEQAVAALSMRHEALRTVFRLVDGRLSQVVLTRPLYGFAVADLVSITPEQQPAALDDQLREHSHAHVSLQHGPVLKALLIRLAPKCHVLAFTMHHIVCDGWSNGILVRDFTAIYEAIRAGCNPSLSDLPFQFADYAAWQAEYLASGRAATALEFWTGHIGCHVPALDLPTDRPRTAGRSFAGRIESRLMPAALKQKIVEYCRRSGSTKHIVLLAAFQALCKRYTDQELFLLGSTIAGRTQPGMEDVVGRFANPQIVVADVKENPSFSELELRVREWETTAYTHQDLPFSQIVEAFQIDQAGVTSQFLQVWFVYQKAFMQPQAGSTIHVTPRRSVSGGVDFDMLVSVVERAEGPRIQIEYNTGLFTSTRIEELLEAYEQLLDHALHAPETRVSDLKLEKASGEAPSSRPPVSNPPSGEPAKNDLFANWREHRSRNPEAVAVAVSDSPTSLNWKELGERSDALSALIASRVSGSQPTVVIHCAPQCATVVAFAAALKAGASILPVPAHVDAKQLGRAANAAKAQIVFAPRAYLTGLATGVAFEDIHEFSAEAQKQALARSSKRQSPICTDERMPSSLQALTPSPNPFYKLCSRLDITRDDSLLCIASKSAGECWFDHMLAFVSGARLTLWDGSKVEDLQTVLNQHQITGIVASPSTWREILFAGWRGDRRVTALVRGEAACSLPSLSARVQKSWRIFFSEITGDLVGASQTGSSACESMESLCDGPLALLDAAGYSVPPGAVGELAEASTRTGLLAQSHEGGGFRVLAPKHKIIQLHGQRLRLIELEEALLQNDQVREVEAVVQHDSTGQQALVAFVVPSTGCEPNPDILRKHLSSHIPPQLVPSEIVLVSSSVRQLNGSLVITGLPPVNAPISIPQVDLVAHTSANEIENRLSDIWKEVLGLRRLDTQTSFFDLGGNSLLLVRLFARINKAFSTSLPITAIFDAETISELAAQIGKQTDVHPIVPVQVHGQKRPLFMVHSYLLYNGLSRMLGADQPFYGLRETESDGDISVEERVARYVREIRNVQPQGPYAVAGWCAAGPLTVEVARQLVQGGDELSAVILFDSWLPGYQASIEKQSRRSWIPSPAVVKSKIEFHQEKVRHLSPTQKLRYARSAVQRLLRERRDRILLRYWSELNKLSKHFHLPLPQFMHNTSLQTFAALQDYKETGVPIQLTLVRASDAREVEGANAYCGWDRVAEHGVNVLWAPGDHETMFVGKNLEATADLVRRSLAGDLPVRSVETRTPELQTQFGQLAEVGTL